MVNVAAFAGTAAVIGDPARAAMLAALMDGRALTATELAWAAGITPQTASGHLAQLTAAALVAVTRRGRHRYHRLASAAVAAMLEGIMAAAEGEAPRRRVVVGPRDRALRHARTCYDHLAGEVAVALADRLVGRGHVVLSADGGAVTGAGREFFGALGVDIGAGFCRPCLDWSERRAHLAGVLGSSLWRYCFERGWLRPVEASRAVTVTPAGVLGLRETFDLRLGTGSGV
jgi:DNA-binding transcriptional ArsR family regulator